MCIAHCRLMNIWIYLHKACTKLLQLTVIGWTITLLSKDGWGGSFFPLFLEAIFHWGFFFQFFFFLSFFFDSHTYCDDMQIANFGTDCFYVFFPLSAPRWRDVETCAVPRPGWCCRGFRFRVSKREARPPALVLGDFMILWLAANYWEGIPAWGGCCRGGSHKGFK